jgi:ParB family chromosome partitioning protein
MPNKKPASISSMFAAAGASQQVADLSDRVRELEEEIKELRESAIAPEEKKNLEIQIQELTEQLRSASGEHHLKLEQIVPDPDQPRTMFPPSVIKARAKSLKEEGQIDPIIVIPLADGTYKIFDGELRWRSAPQAGLENLRAVFLYQERDLDPIEIFDRQLTTSIQTEKLHDLDLAKALTKLITLRHPSLEGREEEFPSILNAAIQRIKRSKRTKELSEVRFADFVSQQEWLKTSGLREEEQWLIGGLLGKQLNPVSINSNVFPLLKLPSDLQFIVRETGIESSKAKELSKLTAVQLGVEESFAVHIRREIAQKVIEEKLSLEEVQNLIRGKLINTGDKPASDIEDPEADLPRRFKRLSQKAQLEKALQDPKKKAKLSKLILEMEKLLGFE